MRKYLPILPAVVVFVVGFFLPLGVVAVTGFFSDAGLGRIDTAFSLQNYRDFFGDSYYRDMLIRTLSLSATTAVLTAIIGYPLAWIVAKHRSATIRTLILVIVTIPLLTSSVVRSFGWMVLFEDGSILSTIFAPFADPNTGLMYTHTGVLIAMVHVLLPLMVITLSGVIEGLDDSKIEAGYSLGGSRLYVFRRVILPLTFNGVVAGMLLVFATAMSTFVTPKVIGGPTYRVLATEIFEQSVGLLNWPFASAMSMVLMLTALVAAGLYSALVKRIGATR